MPVFALTLLTHVATKHPVFWNCPIQPPLNRVIPPAVVH